MDVWNALLATNNFGNTRSGSLAGPEGLVFIGLLVIVTVLLIKNMNARLRRLPERFPAADDAGSGTGQTGPDPDVGAKLR